ncbi:MAG: 3-oxoadipate enol-lactonase [Chloroflexota bacterium]
MMSSTQFMMVGDVALHYTVDGQADNPALLFLNSLGSDLRIWDEILPHFANDYFIIRHDKRGHGLSDCPPAPYTIRDHAADVEGLLNGLNIDQVILIGVSVGGLIALDYAIHNPAKVKGLVLCDTAAKLGATDYWEERIGILRESGFSTLREAILSRWFSPSFPEQFPAEYRGYANMLTRTPVAGYIGTCEALRDADLREAATSIQAQSLVLCGAEDSATPPELVQGLADRLPNSHFELIDNAGHIPSLEQPEAMAQTISQFLSTLGK